jgi:hypothetical protein
VQVETLVLRNVQVGVKLPQALADLKGLTTLAVFVQEGGAKQTALGLSLQQLMLRKCLVLAYEFDSSNRKWKEAPFS